MARQGTEKRRTGCVTCKKRRVKCDEARPVCRRCHIGDRSCVYLEPPVGSYSWQHLLQAKPSILPPLTDTSSQNYTRGLDYFRWVVAPALNWQLGNTFWTEPVMQLMMSEEAAMHGILAISVLYEGFEPGWKNGLHNETALKHYNHAMRFVATKELQDSIILVASVLFTCIEFLLGNKEAAITHCRYGILMSRSSVAQDRTVCAMLRHLSIFPYFFSTSENFLPANEPCNFRFENALAAAFEMDELMGRSIRLVRSLDAYRLGADPGPVSVGTLKVREVLLQDLTAWKVAFTALSRHPVEPTNCRSLLLMRHLVCWIWVNIAPERDETASDAFREEFAQIVGLANRPSEDVSRPKFTFDMGIAPLLHFVVIKCRHLQIRLEALEHIRTMGNARESLWDTATMYAIGKCLIEKEHGILVTIGMSVKDKELPTDDSRVRDSYVEDVVSEDIDEHGEVTFRRKIYLFVCEGAAVVKKAHWLTRTVSGHGQF
ncbi:C6 zinc finger domain-containing protein [Fusarium flagelliforme]|uniref:C6 zinc finger domain-containing protein n=1 Tax=Fusarium flagelliforme TaxID=2675880 RepID=UPI001E8D7D40|nr:C6 zinc finger domain-containing protein [Fusarium flagelliforme]KAH7173991.1 C6 zinc finger domain-containing protein [Fusarium flagelliforme]